MLEDKLLAIIVSYNPDNTLHRLLDSIRNQGVKSLLIDNASLGTIITEYKSDYKIINNCNLGLSSALNQGLKFALRNNFKWIITFDQDSAISEKFFKHFSEALSKSPHEESFVPKISSLNTASGSDNNSIFKFITSGHLFKSSVVKKVGFYDDNLFIDAIDLDYFIRINKYCKTRKVEKAILIHEIGEDIGNKKLRHTHDRVYYIVRNNIYVAKKHFHSNPIGSARIIRGLFLEIVHYLFEDYSTKNAIFSGVQDAFNNKYGKR